MLEKLTQWRIAIDVLWKLLVVALLASIAMDVHDMANAMYEEAPDAVNMSAPHGTL